MNEKIYKSCPSCSNNTEEYIFYSCPEDFGITQKRSTNYNPLGLQSHCSKCRAGKQGPYENSVKCSELSSKNGFIINDINFLNMSSNRFPTYEAAKEFILYEMPNSGCTYYYVKSEMDCEDNTFVLFQYCGTLIGYAIFDKTVVLDKPIYDGYAMYSGYYVFKSGSIRLLKNSITVDTFKIINQKPKRKLVGILPAVFNYIEDGEDSIETNDYIISLPEEIDEQESKLLKEGHRKQIIVNAYERNPVARARCLSYYRKLNGGRIKC